MFVCVLDTIYKNFICNQSLCYLMNVPIDLICHKNLRVLVRVCVCVDATILSSYIVCDVSKAEAHCHYKCSATHKHTHIHIFDRLKWVKWMGDKICPLLELIARSYQINIHWHKRKRNKDIASERASDKIYYNTHTEKLWRSHTCEKNTSSSGTKSIELFGK